MAEQNVKTYSYLAGILFDMAGLALMIAHQVALGAAFFAIGAFWFVYPSMPRKDGS